MRMLLPIDGLKRTNDLQLAACRIPPLPLQYVRAVSSTCTMCIIEMSLKLNERHIEIA